MKLFEGIRIENGEVVFDFKMDLPTDVIPLKFQKINKSLSTRQGTRIYFAYKYNESANPEEIAKVRQAIKMLDYSTISESDLKLMISKSVNNFLSISDNNFDVIVTPKSSGGLANKIAQAFKDKLGSNVLIATDSIVKASVNDIQIDPEKLKKMNPGQIQNINKVIQSATKDGSFKMKSVPIPMRRTIIDFMKFDNAMSREIFNRIAQGSVLLIDDIYTGGSTFNEMSRLINLQSSNPLTGFVFLLSK